MTPAISPENKGAPLASAMLRHSGSAICERASEIFFPEKQRRPPGMKIHHNQRLNHPSLLTQLRELKSCPLNRRLMRRLRKQIPSRRKSRRRCVSCSPG